VDVNAVISHDLLASYAADAALETTGVQALVAGPRRQRGVRVSDDAGAVTVEVHLSVAWDANAAQVAADVQSGVARYLARVAPFRSVTVDVVVTDVGVAVD
jgi:uncharacterized alkaline shock family protein YloU